WESPNSVEMRERSVKRVGGLDFGFRNPFAAGWGVVDRDRVLWLTGEHYAAEKPLAYHAEHLPRGMMWYADPSRARDTDAPLRANFEVRTGLNDLRLGIMAVRARLENGTVKVLQGRCPNLLREAGLYRWGESGEQPVDAHNHALAALRYLIASLDELTLARHKTPPPPTPPADTKERTLEEVLQDETLWRDAA